jgi:hypothetical protein
MPKHIANHFWSETIVVHVTWKAIPLLLHIPDGLRLNPILLINWKQIFEKISHLASVEISPLFLSVLLLSRLQLLCENHGIHLSLISNIIVRFFWFKIHMKTLTFRISCIRGFIKFLCSCCKGEGCLLCNSRGVHIGILKVTSVEWVASYQSIIIILLFFSILMIDLG